MAYMTRRDTVAWVKEEILAAIDKKVAELKTSRGDDEIDRDEELELEKQRNRVARFLGLPENPTGALRCGARVNDGGQNICTRPFGHRKIDGDDADGHRCKAADDDENR